MLTGEAAIRLGAFFAVFAAMALWEALAPRRHDAADRPVRWTNNLAILVVDVLVVRLVAPASAVGIAIAVEARGAIAAGCVPHAGNKTAGPSCAGRNGGGAL